MTNKIISIPEEQWAVLEQTLELDARSSNFDRELREDISKALNSIEYLDDKPVGEIVTMIFMDTTDDLVAITVDGVKIPDQHLKTVWAGDTESGICPVCATDIPGDIDPAELKISDNVLCSKCGVNLAVFDDVQKIENRLVIAAAYTNVQHQGEQ